MKSINILFLLTLVAFAAKAQNKKYIQTMESSIPAIYQAKTLEDFDPLVNKFDRIGQAESQRWEPYYYASLAHVFKAFRIEDLKAKDMALDQALTALEKGSAVSENNAEILALRGFINMIKIGVDPGTRGQTLSPKIMADYSKALQIDPENPRALLFKGQMLFGTAQFFGTGVDQACALVDQSIALFDAESPESTIAPRWGKHSALQYKEQCKVALTKPAEEEEE